MKAWDGGKCRRYGRLLSIQLSLVHEHQQNMSAEQTKSLKRRRAQEDGRQKHSLSHVQHQPAQTEAAAQDEAFVQAQLMRSICTALAIVGYDSVKPSALEMFRSHVQECA